MNRRRKTVGGVLLIASLLFSAGVFAADPPAPAKGGFTSAKVCGGCHVAIFEGWKGSMHANAVSDPIFYPVFLQVSRETGGKADALCLSCHAPLSRVTKDLRMDSPLNQEGVACDFCHRIREVHLGKSEPFVLERGNKKWGPLSGIASPFHEVGYAPHFEQSILCAPCHDYANEKGVPILETYSEWKKGPYSGEGKTCQTCHMPAIEGVPVPPRVKPVKEIYINSHEAAGGHFVEQLKKAISVRIRDAKRSGEKVYCAVDIQNVASGHKVPTGIPTRKLILQLRALSGQTPVYTEERVFQKVLADAKGVAITKDADLFLKAARVQSDNRLAPRETRTEHFSFYAPATPSLTLEVKVSYLYQPRLIQETEMKVELGSQTRTVP